MTAAPWLNVLSDTGAHLLWLCSEHPEYLGTGWNISDWAGNGFQSNFQLKLSRHLSRHSQGCISQMAISQSRIKSLILNRLCLGESEGYRAYSSLRLECNYDFWGTVRINDCICQVFWKNSILHAIPWASDIPASTTMQIPTVTAYPAVWIVMPKQRAVLPSSTACLHSVRSPNLYQKLLKFIKSITKWSRCFLSFYWHDFLGLEGMTYLPVFKG